MKKLFFLSVMLTAAMAVSAQLKIAPKMQKGLTKVYNVVATTNIPGQKEVNITTDMKYTVTEANADGYVVDVLTTTFTSDATSDNIAGQLLSGAAELLKGLNVRVATNNDGRAEKIVNYAELRPKMDDMCDKLIKKMYQAIPQMSQLVPKEPLRQQLMESLTEEKLLKSMQNATSVMTLNGKTVMTGAQEEYVNEQGMKMKRLYFVNGKNIVTNSSMNMSKDELKALLIAQVEKLAPAQADMIKQNIDTVIESGMLKMDMKETATYDLLDDGWVKSVTVDTTTDTMGQTAKSHTVITCK
ncbi:hypothetical protein [Prevotella sp. tf2-5]|uniref:hypothetical protein n=1 Tax=Prevotella sp. tf2-5 TaxID=1761889 RepID=UPI0008EF2E88|nr:hypothetical protein [Prevotella sp. tf2-5]SFP10370.1 hypothetical protein SAMN04487852_11618 [Prevotella sp. tf2-5]